VSRDSVAVRPATTDDSAAVWPLALEFATSFTPIRPVFEQTFATLVDDPHTLLLVAEADEVAGEAIVGYLLANEHLTFLANGPVVWVEEVMVADPARRAGVGGRLMAEAEAWAGRVGAAYISLASRRAQAFYLALGYTDSASFFKKTL
jgi:GNAT superfamily N-acetyltransferase